jgi:hypothetical protein
LYPQKTVLVWGKYNVVARYEGTPFQTSTEYIAVSDESRPCQARTLGDAGSILPCMYKVSVDGNQWCSVDNMSADDYCDQWSVVQCSTNTSGRVFR